jgi:hypothetical protein
MQNLFPQNPDPALDPTHRQDAMVYMMGQEVFPLFILFELITCNFDSLLSSKFAFVSLLSSNCAGSKTCRNCKSAGTITRK